MQNQLANHASPYLAMHGQDPVAWQDWSPTVLQQAQREGKLILISSGYFSCHWCHVMRRESYNNQEIAALLNNSFIPVKLDRELESALDQYLIDFVQQTQGRAGWPLNVFLTPEGYPLVGFTYLPAKDFQRVLAQLGNRWQDDRQQLTDAARRAVLALLAEQKKTRTAGAPLARDTLLARFEKQALDSADILAGGFGQQSKFPMTAQFSLLLKLAGKDGQGRVAEFVRLTLNQMANQGMRDQLGGGFFRYAVDPQWQVPHYEKMLYSQALLAMLYLDAGAKLGSSEYLDVAADTLDFALRDMRGRQGGFVSSFSAVDGRDVEGGYYLWDSTELSKILTEQQLKIADRYWRLGLSRHLTGDILLLGGVKISDVASASALSEVDAKAELDNIKATLLKARRNRVLPVDSKELAGWNGLMLAALSQAATQLKRDDYRQAAQGLRDFLLAMIGENGQLARAHRGQEALGSATLEDYAFVADGLMAWSNLIESQQDRAVALGLLRSAWGKFYSEDGWRLSESEVLPGMPRMHAQQDEALPAPVSVILRLSLHSGDVELNAKATTALQKALADSMDNPFWHASLLEIE